MFKELQRRPPGEGERSARLGYLFQDRASAHLLCEALKNRQLRWIGLADRSSGVADDLVLGLKNAIVAHQFKNSATPKPIGLTALLLGRSKFIADLAQSFKRLKAQFPGYRIVIRYLNVNPPSENDCLIETTTFSSTKAFINERKTNRGRPLAEWRRTEWAPLIDQLVNSSGLCEADFEDFWNHLELVLGEEASLAFEAPADTKHREEIEEVARAIPALIVDTPRQDRWSRSELIAALGWRDPFATRFSHTFPVGNCVQKNDLSESRLVNTIGAHESGYLSVVGAPGTGKSTLLQTSLRDGPGVRVVRYLAFVPGSTQGQGRGEAESFYEDINAELAAAGFKPIRLKDRTLLGLQQIFEDLLAQAGEQYAKNGIRHVIIVDGLDHVPREERPNRSMLSALPLPQSIPKGVLFILGTQRLDLNELAPAVREEAASSDRRVDIAPLSEEAVTRIAVQLGLPDDIAPSEVYAITAGHPLITRYLIKRLISANRQMRDDLLAGQYGFNGELENIYTSVWREIENLPNSNIPKKILALVGFAEGPIEPHVLAAATSDEAVERTLTEAAHLLSISDVGWTAFHNSFRLFLQTKPVEKYGVTDPDYTPCAIYRTLSKLVRRASEFSPQHWLEFRYLYKAGAYEDSLQLVDRKYFVEQYCAGRSARAVQGDIDDAFKALSMRPEPVKLFELLLAHDEVGRRAHVMEGAYSLPDAYVAIGDLRSAADTLSDSYEEGRQWVVVDALLDNGRIEEARRIFEEYSPFRPLGANDTIEQREVRQAALPWATRAIVFMDKDQLHRFVSEFFSNFPTPSSAIDREPEDIAQTLKFEIARAYASADPFVDLEELADIWGITKYQYPIILLEAALSLSGENEYTTKLLRTAADHPAVGELHVSWLLHAARYAAQMGQKHLAQKFLAFAPLQGLDTIDDIYNNEVRLAVCRRLVRGIVLRVAIGMPLPELGLPKTRLVKGIQYHLISIARAIGEARTGKPPTEIAVERIVRDAMNFLASEQAISDEDHSSDHYPHSLSPVILEVLFTLIDVTSVSTNLVADISDELISHEKARFRWWPYFRRQVALTTFSFDGDASAARKRLEDACEAFDTYDPRLRAEQAASFAVAFAQIGSTAQAAQIISDLRREALAVFLPAKKDGQYELWNALLGKANSEDPNRRVQRANTVLKLIDGLREGEGSDMATRIARQVLFEAAADDANSAWNGADWAASTGVTGWDGIVDTTLRGMIFRKALPLKSILTTWSHLCLPWYNEPYSDSERMGQFLRDLIKAAEPLEVETLETGAVRAIAEQSRPEIRLSLLGILEEATTFKGHGQHAREKKQELIRSAFVDSEDNPNNKSYYRLTTLPEALDALADERAYFAKTDEKSHISSDFSWELRRALPRVLATLTWDEAKTFCKKEPDLAKNFDVIRSLIPIALAAGEKDSAMSLAAPVLNSDENGWEWTSGYGDKKKHELRHLLKVEDAYEAAQRDFFEHLTTSRYGVYSLIWEIETIFPLLFDNVDWVGLWNSLEAYIHAMHDFKVGCKVNDLNEVSDDASLMAAICVRAISLDVPLLLNQATAGLHELREQGNHELFGEVVLRLLANENKNVLVAMDLLTEAHEDHIVCEQFSNRLQDLASNSDAGVVASAMFLATFWQVHVLFEHHHLPSLYNLHFVDDELPSGHTLSDQQTRSLVLDDVLAWTDAWSSPVKWIAKWSGFSRHHIRFRVGQLVQSWGGVEAFGHPASKRLEQDLSRIDLRLTYRRPQAEAVLRAMRHVVSELWRAKRLSSEEVVHILFDLYSSPKIVNLPNFQQRPNKKILPDPPKVTWIKDHDAWLEAVSDDIVTSKIENDELVFADWHRITIQDLRGSNIIEGFAAIGKHKNAFGSLDEIIADLPKIIFTLKLKKLYDKEDIHPSRIATFDPHHMNSPVDQLLVFCPHTATELDWVQDPFRPHIYRDSQDQEMARTTIWRDGLPQQTNEQAKFAQGQRIVFSEAGRRQFEAAFGKIELAYTAWRHIAQPDDRDRADSRTASSAS